MFLFGDKKKLQVLNRQVQTKTEELNVHKDRLVSLDKEKGLIDEDVKRITELIENERRDQAQGQIEKSRLVKETEDDKRKIARLEMEIADAKEASDQARSRKEWLLGEVAEAERRVHAEHVAAEASFVAARDRADQLEAQHKSDRELFMSIKGQQRDLVGQLDSSLKQLEESRAQRDEAKRACKNMQQDLDDLRHSHKLLQQDHEATEARLSRERSTSTELEKRLADLDAQHEEIMTSYKDLEETHRLRQGQLQMVADDLDTKHQALFYELKDFEARFHQAKMQRQLVLQDHAPGIDNMKTMLPDLPRIG